jgi:CRP-like cAMP-binding protein
VRGKQQAAFERQLAASRLFSALSPEQIHHLARTATRAYEPKGMVFAKEGERGDEIVVLLEGTVEVRHDDKVLARLGPGDHFGEIALLDDTARRSATVVAVTAVAVAYVSRHHFDTLLATNPSVRAAVERVLRERSVVPKKPTGGSPSADQ